MGKVLAGGGKGIGILAGEAPRKRSTNAADSGRAPNPGSPFSLPKRKKQKWEEKTKTRVAPNWQS